MSFDPKKHLTKVKGKDYLEVKWRLVWFRENHPDYNIDTNFLVLDMDQGIAICQAKIYNSEGKQVASGTKTEYKASFFDFVEKSETGAIGRALATLGYGTQFAPELEEGERIVDSPVEPKDKKQTPKGNKQTNDKQDKQLSRQEIIDSINKAISNRDFSNGEAKEILSETFGKDSCNDCSDQELIEYLEILKKERCQDCREKITEKVVKYCDKNKDTFEGKYLCIACQKLYKDK